ncbi:MAG: hydroxyacylglutathione hydrolase [Gammaproteobacteria bacterium]|nr:hydroxyacylglutathione hydrolase [Gammaproteobacteria bacterium]
MINIKAIPAFSDNYIWMLHAEEQKQVVLVDPGEAQQILHLVKTQHIEPVAILLTHHHADHTGGVSQLLKKFPDMKIYGPEKEKISSMTHPLKEDDEVFIPEINARFKVIDVPGHTSGHIAYYSPGILFCGDTLFACGCGRVFEGTMAQMEHSLSKLALLPAETMVYCAHEYTLDNIGFAKWVEPDNKNLLQREIEDNNKRKQEIPTVPSTLEMELKTNPFLRYKTPEVIEAAEKFSGKKLTTNAEVFGAIRYWKDTEYD